MGTYLSSCQSWDQWCYGWLYIYLSEGGHMTNLTYKKNVYIYLQKKKLYTKLTYCDNYNKNVEYPYLKITKIWVR